MITIPITADEIATICEALRYTAADMDAAPTLHRRNEVSALRGLAYALEARHRAAVEDAGRVERVGEEE